MLFMIDLENVERGNASNGTYQGVGESSYQ